MTWYKNIPIKNIYLLFYYAMCGLGMRPYKFDRINEDEDFESVEDALAAILSVGIGWQLKQGLYREYIDKTEDLPTIRGKIDMVGTIRNKIARRQLISCEYDELSENNLGNQILKTTVMLLLREKNVKKERKNDLRKEMRYFSNVEEIRNLTSIQWSKLRFHRGNQVYQTLLFFCQMVLDRNLLNTEGGRKMKSFLREDMVPKLYEKFILGYYQTKFSNLSPDDPWIKWAGAKEDDFLPGMHTDITLSYPKKKPDKVLIIDAKCYENKSKDGDSRGKIHSDNLYQIYAYVKNEFDNRNMWKAPDEEKTEVSGMLLYAQTYKKGESGEPKEPLTETVLGGPYNMNRNRIHVRTLDLSKDFSCISEELDMIANEFFGPTQIVFVQYCSRKKIFSEAKQQG